MLMVDCDGVDLPPVAAKIPVTATRLRDRMIETGTTQDFLADAVGATQGAISQILTGMTRRSRFLPEIATVLAVNLDWLVGTSDQMIDMYDADGNNITEDDLALIRVGKSEKRLKNPQQLLGDATGSKDKRLTFGAFPKSEAESDTVELPELDVAYGMGSTYIHDAPVKFQMRTFSRAWVRQFTGSPFDRLYWATGNGTSMMPAILDNDILLIDKAQQTPRMWDQFWAVEMHGLGMVKALRPGREGAMRLISINPDWPEELAYDGEMTVIGRVVAIVRKV